MGKNKNTRNINNAHDTQPQGVNNDKTDSNDNKQDIKEQVIGQDVSSSTPNIDESTQQNKQDTKQQPIRPTEKTVSKAQTTPTSFNAEDTELYRTLNSIGDIYEQGGRVHKLSEIKRTTAFLCGLCRKTSIKDYSEFLKDIKVFVQVFRTHKGLRREKIFGFTDSVGRETEQLFFMDFITIISAIADNIRKETIDIKKAFRTTSTNSPSKVAENFTKFYNSK